MKKTKIAKALLPFMLLGSPALAGSSVRSGSRFKAKKAVVQNSTKSAKKSVEKKDPFSSFGSSYVKETVKSEEKDVLAFLKENDLLAEKQVVENRVSGDSFATYRKEFSTCTYLPSAYVNESSCVSQSHVWNNPDSTAPTLSAISSSNIEQTTVDVKGTSNEAGTMYYVIATSSSSPTYSQVSGNTVTNSVKSGNSAVSAATAKTFSVTGLTAGTQYYYYIVAKDASNNESSVSNGTFTTVSSNTAPTISGAVASQAVNDNATLSPFSGVTLFDADANNISVTIALDDNAKGTLSSTSIASTSVAAAQAALRAITFNPTDNRVAPGSSETTTFTITVNDGTTNSTPNTTTTVISTSVNDAPTDITLSSATVAQSGGTNASVGTLGVTDADTGDTATYTLVAGTDDTNNGSFNISGTSLRANDSGALAAGTYKIRLNVNDGDANFEKAFTITVSDDVVPTLSAVSSANVLGTTVDLKATSNETGNMYYVIASSSSTPTADNVINNTVTNSVKNATSAVTASTAKTFSVTGLSDSTQYYYYIVTVDVSSNKSTVSSGTFTTADTTAPSKSSSSPADDATTVSTSANLTFTFSENITKGTGDIVLYKTDGTVIETFDVATSGQIGVATNTLTINPTNNLISNQSYYIQMAATAIKDSAGNSFAGINDVTTWNFTTAQPSVTLSSSSVNIAENGGIATLTATLNGVSSSDVTVNLAKSGTATDTTDYTLSSTSIVINAGNTTGTATLTGVDDLVTDAAETVIIDIASVTGGTESGNQQETITITDDDSPGITLSKTTASVSESGSTDTFTVKLNTLPTGDVVIDISSNDTGEVTLTPATLTLTTANWSTPQTVTLTGVDDSLSDGDQNSIVTLSINQASTADTDYDAVGDKTLTVTTTNNAAPIASNFTYATAIGSSAKTFNWKTLSSASDTDGTIASASIHTNGTKGTATISADSITYTPATNKEGSDTIVITISDDGGATVNITITVQNINTYDATADDDNDGISNIDEGITTNRDSDGDGIPDYLDTDSDNDGKLDKDEGLSKYLDFELKAFDLNTSYVVVNTDTLVFDFNLTTDAAKLNDIVITGSNPTDNLITSIASTIHATNPTYSQAQMRVTIDPVDIAVGEDIVSLSITDGNDTIVEKFTLYIAGKNKAFTVEKISTGNDSPTAKRWYDGGNTAHDFNITAPSGITNQTGDENTTVSFTTNPDVGTLNADINTSSKTGETTVAYKVTQGARVVVEKPESTYVFDENGTLTIENDTTNVQIVAPDANTTTKLKATTGTTKVTTNIADTNTTLGLNSISSKATDTKAIYSVESLESGFVIMNIQKIGTDDNSTVVIKIEDSSTIIDQNGTMVNTAKYGTPEVTVVTTITYDGNVSIFRDGVAETDPVNVTTTYGDRVIGKSEDTRDTVGTSKEETQTVGSNTITIKSLAGLNTVHKYEVDGKITEATSTIEGTDVNKVGDDVVSKYTDSANNLDMNVTASANGEAIHFLKKDTDTVKATSKIIGAKTTMKETDGKKQIVTKVSTTTSLNKALDIEVTANDDASAKHKMSLKDSNDNTVEVIANFNVKGATTTIETDGSIETNTTQTIGSTQGVYKAKVDKDGYATHRVDFTNGSKTGQTTVTSQYQGAITTLNTDGIIETNTTNGTMKAVVRTTVGARSKLYFYNNGTQVTLYNSNIEFPQDSNITIKEINGTMSIETIVPLEDNLKL